MYRIIKRIINWTGDYKGRLYKGFIYSFFNAIFTALPIMAAASTFNLILDVQNGKRTFDVNWIWEIFVFLIIAVLLRFFTAYRKAVLQESIGYEMACKERINIGNILKRVPLGFFENNSSGDLVNAVTTDLSFVELYGMKMIDTVVNGYIIAFTMVFCLCFYSIPLAIISFLGIIFSALTLKALGNKSKKNAPLHLKAQEKMTGATIEYIHGIPIVKAFGKQGAAIKSIREAYKDSKKINIKIEKQYTPYNCIHLFILKAASVLIVILSSYLAMRGDLSISNMIMMTIFSFSIFGSVETVNDATHVLELIDNTMDKIESIKNTKFIDEDSRDVRLKAYDVKFHKVSFGYDEKTIIKNVSFNIPQNTTTAIVGPSGSGKTTIYSLMSKFYNPNSGKILIGGEDISNITCESLLSNISMVFQKVYLFHDTILNNIKFGNPKASYDEVVEAAKKACCHDFIMELPNGYDTVIGEGGSSLSGGQKQRLSIARAILKDAPIVILDEATASVDPENEYYIQQAINALTHGKTIIIIAHRLATIENADQILVLEQGNIVQRGTHKELIKEKGLYRRFIGIREKAESWNI
ncbi:ABC transporter ATP-binding protein [Clostridium neuense]|uniref:ABC transporter ATP-binding protein n=1 Tax=Clostridium neuense TaxID=1728934 RepID=A0ABW8TI64_9CLOT